MAQATCFDVAEYILQQLGPLTTWKLQKLVYYCQAWSLVWDEEPLFDECIEAWSNGPVIPELYDYHRGQFIIDSVPGDPDNLEEYQKDTIDSVLESYGDSSAQWLSDLTHMEEPWNEARQGLEIGEPCRNEITLSSMHEYYSSLPIPDEEK
jgi:uncharacterized phage-associated protein